MHASEVELIHARCWTLRRVIRRIAALLHIFDLQLGRFLTRATLHRVPVVVHDENHGQVARVGHRVACIAEDHLILLQLLARATAHARLCRASYRLIHRDLIQVARLDIRRLRLLMVWHLD